MRPSDGLFNPAPTSCQLSKPTGNAFTTICFGDISSNLPPSVHTPVFSKHLYLSSPLHAGIWKGLKYSYEAISRSSKKKIANGKLQLYEKIITRSLSNQAATRKWRKTDSLKSLIQSGSGTNIQTDVHHGILLFLCTQPIWIQLKENRSA